MASAITPFGPVLAPSIRGNGRGPVDVLGLWLAELLDERGDDRPDERSDAVDKASSERLSLLLGLFLASRALNSSWAALTDIDILNKVGA